MREELGLKKLLPLWVVVLGASIVFGSFSLKKPETPEVLGQDLVRFHIIAASDKKEDQELKLQLRDEVLAYLYPKLKSSKNKEETIKILKKEVPGLKNRAEQFLKSKQKPVPVEVAVGKFYFPDRSYGEYLVPSGYYDALKISLGEAKGHNWWCILYPKLCFADWGRMEPSHVKSYYLKSLFLKKFKKTVKRS